ncbi:type IX secretion system membrane protein PorP/SprF [soil metagenome]
MKKLLVLTAIVALFMVAGVKEARAQQDAQYSMYMFNGLAVNPAYAGSRERPVVLGLYRHQWAGFGAGVPRTALIAAHAPLMNDRIGLGLSLASDNIGVTNMTNVTASYAYRLPVGKGKWAGKLAFGIDAQFNNYRHRWSEITSTTGGDPSFANNSQNVFSPNFGAGVYYYNEKFYLGASIPHMLNASLRDKVKLSGTDLTARMYRHYFFTGGAIITLNENLKLRPSFLFKYVDNAPFQGDYNVSLLIKEALWIGASFRSSFQQPAAVVGIIEYMFVKGARLGYAYDHTFTAIGAYQSGSHEIMLSYEFGKKDKYLSPRRMSYF